VAELVATFEKHFLGESEMRASDLLDEWRGLELSRDIWLVELERVSEPEPGKLLGRCVGAHQVPARERPAEDRVRVALRGRRRSSLGRTAS
jgi:hypothetical protein